MCSGILNTSIFSWTVIIGITLSQINLCSIYIFTDARKYVYDERQVTNWVNIQGGLILIKPGKLEKALPRIIFAHVKARIYIIALI